MAITAPLNEIKASGWGEVKAKEKLRLGLNRRKIAEQLGSRLLLPRQLRAGARRTGFRSGS